MSVDQTQSDSVLDALKRSLLAPNDWQLDNPSFDRFFPNDIISGGVMQSAGNSITIMRYLPRDPTHPDIIKCGKGYSITLDPRFTAPNAQIGVAFGQASGQRSGYFFLRPGDTIHVPNGFTQFNVICNDYSDRLIGFGNQSVYPVGYCSFLVGRMPNAAPVFADNNPFSSAAVIGFGNVAGLRFPTIGLRKLRFTIAAASNIGSLAGGKYEVGLFVLPRLFIGFDPPTFFATENIDTVPTNLARYAYYKSVFFDTLRDLPAFAGQNLIAEKIAVQEIDIIQTSLMMLFLGTNLIPANLSNVYVVVEGVPV